MNDLPKHPCDDNQTLNRFQAELTPPTLHKLNSDGINNIRIAPTDVEVYPGLTVPAWGYGLEGNAVTSPGPLLEVDVGKPAVVRWKNCLPASSVPGQDQPALPFATSFLDDGANGDLNNIGIEDGIPDKGLSSAPIGWTTVHLHGAHSSSDSDGWPDNMVPKGGTQLDSYENTYDNMDLDLSKVGEFLWYHDHAMNGTRYHVFSGLAGGYLLRDPAEVRLGLPVCRNEGEIVLIIQDRNLACDGDIPKLLHKTSKDTGEFFGPLTLVNGKLWPRLPLQSAVYRLRLLNGSNARAYRLHLVSVTGDVVSLEHQRVQVIGTEGGLLWKSWQLENGDALTLAPAERIDLLIDLTGLAEGTKLCFINSAPAPFQAQQAPDIAGLNALWNNGSDADLNRYPWVMQIEVAGTSSTAGKPKELYSTIANKNLNSKFKRLVHPAQAGGTADPEPAPQFLIGEDHDHRIILLGEEPTGHLYLQELVEDSLGQIWLQLPGEPLPPKSYRVDGWMPADGSPSSSRVPFYDHIALRPVIQKWQVWVFINTTTDVHPIHIHQSMFQPLGHRAGRVNTGDLLNYSPQSRRTWSPILATPTDPTAGLTGRDYEPHEVHGWKDVIRVNPGEVVKVAIRFDTPGRYVYHCHVLEHEDIEMMRPFVVTVKPMVDGMDAMPGM